MILGIISILLDVLLLNFIYFQLGKILIFPMFTITFLISSIYFRYDMKKLLIVLVIYSSIIGVIYLPLMFFLIVYYQIHKDKKNFNLKNYLLKISYSLILYDFLYFVILYFFKINSYTFSLLIYKIILSIPLSILYSLLLYYINSVLKKKKNKYKLV